MNLLGLTREITQILTCKDVPSVEYKAVILMVLCIVTEQRSMKTERSS